MARSAAKQASNIFVWIILGLLFVALAGFGIGSFTGNASRIGSVGDVEITAEDYARALQQEIRARVAETRTPVTLNDLRAQGIDQAVLASLVARAALANEAMAMGLSVGDEEVARQITQIPAFQGLDGNFDREAYEFELRQNGLDVAEFEDDVRADTARSLLQVAVIGGIVPNDVIAETIVAYQGETRDFSILTVTESDLPAGLPAPQPADLQSFYEERPELFTRPEAKRITYAWITPSMVMDDVTVNEDTLRALYNDRIDFYVQPERRLLERLVFISEADAQAAFDAITAGETDFDTLVNDRDLSLDDIDLGEVTPDDLPAATAEVIFADTTSEILGPLDSALGPALFRVNAVLEATEVTFEEARDDLSSELAVEAARRQIDDMREDVDDLLAGGATLEELEAETGMQIGTLDYTILSEDGIAGYDAFRDAADAVQDGDFPEMLDLSDGGLFAIRLDEVIPPTLTPFDEAEEDVRAAWRISALRTQLTARAETLMEDLETGTDLEDLGRVTQEQAIRRQDFIPDAPPTLVAQVFQLSEVGETVMVPGPDRAFIARLDSINSPARDQPDTALLLQIVQQTVAQSMAQDLFEAYGQALQGDAGIRLDQAVINAVHTQFQ
ncbi:MAG: SurA N-terminal domain-containing protein [Pseudomonadota bacterium]